MCQGVLTELVGRLAHSETRSKAYNTLKNDARWRQMLAGCGAEVKSEKLVLVMTTSTGGDKEIIVQEGVPISKDWLPGGSLSPCVYSLHLDCVCAVAPLFGSTGSITGVNAPIPLTVSSSAHWENLSRNPRSSTFAFCIDE